MVQERVEIAGRVGRGDGPASCLLPFGDRTMSVPITLSPDQFARSAKEPVQVPDMAGFWLYRDVVVRVQNVGTLLADDLAVRIKHAVVRQEKEYARLRREVEAFENLDAAVSARREAIPPGVQLFVWQRDEGKCVKCSSRERLEFDHVIPVAEGGSNTARNVQLLCEPCNRGKGKRVGGTA